MPPSMPARRSPTRIDPAAGIVQTPVAQQGGVWPSMNWAWKLRGITDKFVGGIGIRRGGIAACAGRIARHFET
jgi:hypothetical protein